MSNPHHTQPPQRPYSGSAGQPSGNRPAGWPGAPNPGIGHQAYPGGGQVPPQRRRAGLWVSLALAGALVAGLLLTGFVTPGFLVRQDHIPSAGSAPNTAGNASAEPAPATSTYSRNSPSQLQAARTVTEEFLKRLNANAIDGPDGAKAMACPGSESLLGGTLLAVEAPTQIAIPTRGETRFRDPVIEVDIAGVTDQRAVTGYLRLQPWQDHQPCVRIVQIH